MKFEFAKATDITEFAKKNFPEMYGGCKKIFITTDVNDYHILRVIEGYGKDYEEEEGSFILEWQKIYKMKTDKISSLNRLKKILEQDDGGNWAYTVFSSFGDVMERVDGGYGVN